MMRRLLFLVAAIGFLTNTAAAKTTTSKKSLLMIGNSFTEYNNLEEMVQAMLQEDMSRHGNGNSRLDHDSIYAMRFRKPASRLAEDIYDPILQSTIAERAWTWVVLQEQSQIPGFYTDPNSDLFPLSMNATIIMNNWIAAAQAETVLLMTWGRRTLDSMNPEHYPNFPTMQSYLQTGYEMYQTAISTPQRPVRIAPAGLAFELIYNSILEEEGKEKKTRRRWYLIFQSVRRRRRPSVLAG